MGKTEAIGNGNGESSEVECVGIGSVCGSCVVLVVLYGKGSDMSDPSEIERLVWIPSLGSQSRLEWQRSML